jgi:hypothetical protein
VPEHAAVVWACYFTDGRYANFASQGDGDADFGLMSWTEAVADCFLSLDK